jgi:predicted flap endonuclease-1-like 5' DNA nuclease
MEWVKGELLNEYIRKHLGNSIALLDLAKRWFSMVTALQAAGIAHGDLQHGNVVVVNGELRLIDYDGMYVPTLAGRASNEVGHRNYQHPQRTEFDFGISTDNFAAWVIYITLLALSIDPGLWHRVQGGDEYLLFRREDFADPLSSATFALLSKHSDQRLETLANFFQSLLFYSPDRFPPLDDQKFAYPSSSGFNTSSTSISGKTAGKPAWLADYETESQPAGAMINPLEPNASQNSTWVLDFITPPPAAVRMSFETDTFKPRLVLAITISVSGMLSALCFFFLLPVAFTFVFIIVTLMTASVFLKDIYRQDATVLKMHEITEREKAERILLEEAQRKIKELESGKSMASADEKKKLKDIESRRLSLQDREKREKEQVQVQLTRSVNTMNARRMKINQEELTALKQIQDRIGTEVANLNRKIAALSLSESEELSKALQLTQMQALNNHLRSYRIADASIPGVGDKLKTRLRYSGITTAADIEYWRVTQVDGIGDNKAMALTDWRRWVESIARTPSSLSQAEVTNIKNKYQAQKQQAEAQRDTAQQQLTVSVSAVKAKFAGDKKAIDDEHAKVQAKGQIDMQDISNKYLPEYNSLRQEQARATSESAELRRKIDDSIVQIRKQVGDHHWQLAMTRRELMPFKDVSYKAFFRFVIFGRHTP